MAGYLTHMMVLIETERWLGQLASSLHTDPKDSLEARLRDLAGKAQNYLRYNSPVGSVAKIDNGVGTGISQYAYLGSIGHDFPANGYILTLNRRWVSETMHKGSPRKALVNARTTKFVLNAIDEIATDGKLAASEKPQLMSYLMGHLSSVATHVVLGPFIDSWAWQEKEKTRIRDRRSLKYALDAKVAKLYFLRDDLRSGQSWSDYLKDVHDRSFWHYVLSSPTDEIEVVLGLYRSVFKKTYGEKPLDPLYAVPPVTELAKKYPSLTDIFNDPRIKEKLEHYLGYEELFADLPEEAAKTLRLRFEHESKAKDELESFRCDIAKFDDKFLMDAYRNTRNWGLDAGYDHGPVHYRILWMLLLLGGAYWTINGVWGNIKDFGPSDPPGIPIYSNALLSQDTLKEFDELKALYQQAWIADGILSNNFDNPATALYPVLFDILDSSYTSAGIIMFLVNTLIGGLGFGPRFLEEGLFGQARADVPLLSWQWVYVKLNDLVFPLSTNLWLNQWFPKFVRHWAWRWGWWIFSFALDWFEADYVTLRSNDKGVEGDELGRQLWYLRLWVTFAYVLTCLTVFITRSAQDRKKQDGSFNDDFNFWLYYLLLGSFWPGLLCVWKLFLPGKQPFKLVSLHSDPPKIVSDLQDDFVLGLLDKVADVQWPGTETQLVDGYLEAAPKPQGGTPPPQNGASKPLEPLFSQFKDGGGAKFQVQLFPDSTLAPNRAFFPQSDLSSAAWINELKSDEQKRVELSEPKGPYSLKQLLQRSVYLSGLLAMAAVQYDEDPNRRSAEDRAKDIFLDWNLDYRTVGEWNTLMETVNGAPGMVQSAEQWWDGLRAERAKAKPPYDAKTLKAAAGRLEKLFGIHAPTPAHAKSGAH